MRYPVKQRIRSTIAEKQVFELKTFFYSGVSKLGFPNEVQTNSQTISTKIYLNTPSLFNQCSELGQQGCEC